MSIHPIQGFKAMSPAKKAATVAGTVAAVGATTFVVASAIKGKHAEQPNEKFIGRVKEGAELILNSAKEKGAELVKAIKNKFAHKPEAAQEVVEDAGSKIPTNDYVDFE